jgi:hypothetical protein
MNLTAEQLQAIKDGQPVRIAAPEIGAELVILHSAVYERIRAAADDSLFPEQVGALIERTMREYDEEDPLLDTYQRYRS